MPSVCAFCQMTATVTVDSNAITIFPCNWPRWPSHIGASTMVTNGIILETALNAAWDLCKPETRQWD